MTRFALLDLQLRFDREARVLDQLLDAHAGAGSIEERVISEYCLVALQDSWSRFVRDLILRSSLGNATTARGRKLPPGPKGAIRLSEALRLLQKGWAKKAKKQGWEPYWYSVNEASRAATILAIPNSGDVLAALGSSANPIEELRPIRNFAVHRLPSTAANAAAAALGLSKSLVWQQPRDIVLVRRAAATGSERAFSSWCRRMSIVASAAVK